ncbi:hypothetical protein N6H14_03890 [Paenibacillus sp. CC-CFT747]|nr:hypothetical protein N6H14_03890 [Paenibacillus sp. CC-CFT747]
MKRILLTFLLFAIGLIPIAALWASGSGEWNPSGRLSGWEYFWEKPEEEVIGRPEPGLVTVPSAGWASIDSPLNPPGRNGSNVLWLRADLPAGTWRDPGLAARLYEMYEVMAEGKVIYTYGTPRAENPAYQGTPLRFIPLNQEWFGGKLYFRIYSGKANIGFMQDAVVMEQAQYIRSLLKEQGSRFILGFFYLLVGMAAIYIAMRVNQKEFLSFGAFGVFFGIYTLCRTAILYLLFDVPKLWTYLELASLILGCTAILAFMEQLFGESYSRINRGLRILWKVHLLYAMVLLPAAEWRLVPFPKVLAFYQLLLLFSMAVSIGVLLYHARHGNRDARILLLGTLCFSAAGAVDIYTNVLLPAAHPPQLSYIGMLVFLFAVISVLVRLLIQMKVQLNHSEKLSVAGRLAAGVAHEIRNPVTVLSGYLQLMKNGRMNPDVIPVMLDEVNRINSIINEFLLLSKPDKPANEKHDVALILGEVISFLKAEAEEAGIRVSVSTDGRLGSIRCSKDQLKQVFINVMKNAMEAMPGGGPIDIELRRDGRELLIRFLDAGEGIAGKDMERLGSPSTRPKRTEPGSAL